MSSPPGSPKPGIAYNFEYVDPVNQHLVCQICHSYMVAPLTTTCGHTFCSACITATVDSLGICPTDRNPLTLAELAPSDKIIGNMLDELMVYCPHRDDGCAWSGQRQLLGGHLRECEHATELCPFTGCDVEMKREELAEHVNNCEYRVVACEKCEAPVAFKDLKEHPHECPAEPTRCQWCGETVMRSDLPTHLDTCLEAEAPCPHSIHGCVWVGERKDIETHLGECKFEAIRGFIELQQWRYDQLLQENHQLRMEIGGLRDALGGVRADLVRDIAALAPPIDLLPHIDRLTADNERVTADVQNITADIASMDLRHNMAVMNESFRMREEMQSLRQMVQVMQSQILYLTERLKDTRGGPPMPPMPSKPPEMDIFGGAGERFAEAVENVGRPIARRPSSARSSSADGSETHGRPMKL